MQLPPKRILQHEIDSEANKQIIRLFDRTWELRDLTGRDFGIDKIAEKFENGIATGNILLLQIKGTEKSLESHNITFEFPTKTLLYAELFSVPFLVLFCSLTDPTNCYYIWLQEYIKIRLEYENSLWRTQENNTLYFPVENNLASKKSIEHLDYISRFTKYKDCWVEYYNALEGLDSQINDLCFLYSDFEADSVYTGSSLQQKATAIHSTLISGLKYIKYIPARFIPKCYNELVQIAKIFAGDPVAPSQESFQVLLIDCKEVASSIVCMAQRFNYSYMRLLYEVDGSADY